VFVFYVVVSLRLIESNHLFPYLYINGICYLTGTASLQPQMSVCIDSIVIWMQSNQLQLNTAMTEVIWCSSSWRPEQISQASSSDSADLTSRNAALQLGNYLSLQLSSVISAGPGIFFDSNASLKLFHHTATDTQHSPACLPADSVMTGGAIGSDTPRLLQCDTDRRIKQPTGPTLVHDECCCMPLMFITCLRH